MPWRCGIVLILAACAPKPGDPAADTTGRSTGESSDAATDPPASTTSPPTTGAPDTTGGDPTTGHTPTGNCIDIQQTHDACPDPCPLTVDVEIRCDDPEFGAFGLRVAADPDAVWLAAAGDLAAYFHAATPTATTRVALPAELARRALHLAAVPSGELFLAAEPGNSGDIVLASADFGWQTSPVTTQHSLIDFEVDDAGHLHLWTRDWIFDIEGFSEILHTGDAVQEFFAQPPFMAVMPHFGLTREGATVGVGILDEEDGYQLASLIVDQMQEFGAASPHHEYRLAPPANPVAPQIGPAFVLAQLRNDGLHAEWQAEAGPLVPDTASLQPMCPLILSQEKSCPGPCHDTAVGVEDGAFMVARTGDGRGWLAHLTTHLDHRVKYTHMVVDVLGEHCAGAVDEDHDAGVLHLYELAFDGSAPQERLALPISAPMVRDLYDFQIIRTGPDLRSLDLRSFGSSLAIGLRTRDTATGELAARLLRFETAP